MQILQAAEHGEFDFIKDAKFAQRWKFLKMKNQNKFQNKGDISRFVLCMKNWCKLCGQNEVLTVAVGELVLGKLHSFSSIHMKTDVPILALLVIHNSDM